MLHHASQNVLCHLILYSVLFPITIGSVIHSNAKSTTDTLFDNISKIILPCQPYIKTQLELVTEKSGFVTVWNIYKNLYKNKNISTLRMLNSAIYTITLFRNIHLLQRKLFPVLGMQTIGFLWGIYRFYFFHLQVRVFVLYINMIISN